MFYVGERVVCIDNGPKKGSIGAIIPVNHLLELGRIYRISGINFPAFVRNRITGEEAPHFDGSMDLTLEGVQMPPPMRGFATYRFRKLIERATSSKEEQSIRDLAPDRALEAV